MLIQTKDFGEIDIRVDDIITFKNGLLGFETIDKYVVIKNPDPELPFHWLQSVDEPWLAFVITNPFLFKSTYEFDIPKHTIQRLEIENIDDVMIYSIAVVPEDIREMTINLSGPIIINTNKKKGAQIIIESGNYPVKHFIFQQSIDGNIE
ncbi:MAG: flagellar assembly protein FliW [Anaerosolibacter sp.]|uniref:flagellar assembly protein FliW n=1 Tax=Anaerosolibacter sp. TaxID=1872527 RepID=UPI00262B48D8|nr:flagellar assembly protein FliW [Anaerosolibacter sp.]MDF2546589.1 flagellar assembly protein FliW [Anaerosolibacter sp.]